VDRKGLVKLADRSVWRTAVAQMGAVALDAHNLETAKRCVLRILAWSRLGVVERLQGLYCMARYHRECKDWIKVVQCCEEALGFSPQFSKEGDSPIRQTEEQLLLLFADAYEGQGVRARGRRHMCRSVWTACRRGA
jgi:hypothetical protein